MSTAAARSATVFAPATVANVAVGFDILGFPIESVGDVITVSTTDFPSVRIKEIVNETGHSGELDILVDPAKNAATVGLMRLRDELRLDFGFEVTIRKGIELGSGMGGSAASAAGALVAANSLLERPLPVEALVEYALLGEQAASGAAHPDNIAPCLFGGLTLVLSVNPVRYVSLPVPASILTVLVHPRLRVDTKNSRSILRPNVPLADHVQQSANLGAFIAGCFGNDLEMIRHSLSDLVIEPQRAPLIPGFADVKAAAMERGAIGASISGSGPSVFAWVSSAEAATEVRQGMIQAFRSHRLTEVDSWISSVSRQGATVIR
ncbi:MAG TPA: homoserine kinase [Pyrinomonadaceae bacterium]